MREVWRSRVRRRAMHLVVNSRIAASAAECRRVDCVAMAEDCKRSDALMFIVPSGRDLAATVGKGCEVASVPKYASRLVR